MCFKAFVLLLWNIFAICICEAVKEEVCNAENFQASCQSNEVIVMESALYGRMRVGRCVERDYGYLGCSNDALSVLDAACSGKQSCDLVVSKKLRKDVEGACAAPITGYAEIAYVCKEVFPVTREHCERGEILIHSTHTLIPASAVKDTCGSTNRWTISADPGQTMNISLWNFKGERYRVYGGLRDIVSGYSAELEGAARFQNILVSVGNVVEVSLHKFNMKDANFLIDIEVIGCADMSPPDGSWMTRDGDVMEVGCHSGSKSWRLQCKKNNWSGVLGYCGSTNEKRESNKKLNRRKAGILSVSLNVLVFGASSLLILFSACIFLAGVIVLKKKLTSKGSKQQLNRMPLLIHQDDYAKRDMSLCHDGLTSTAQQQRNTMRLHDNSDDVNKAGSLVPYSNKELHSSGWGERDNEKSILDYSKYINSTTAGMPADSAKYYVLEERA